MSLTAIFRDLSQSQLASHIENISKFFDLIDPPPARLSECIPSSTKTETFPPQIPMRYMKIIHVCPAGSVIRAGQKIGLYGVSNV
jgi:hypothetical protein